MTVNINMITNTSVAVNTNSNINTNANMKSDSSRNTNRDTNDVGKTLGFEAHCQERNLETPEKRWFY